MDEYEKLENKVTKDILNSINKFMDDGKYDIGHDEGNYKEDCEEYYENYDSIFIIVLSVVIDILI